ncbi:polymorphic toxin type 33 domain-containing protein [Listeria booriae]|uniref:polymorphic toxin type 33 domain-containing protein n=1 Tax=Listeria booriae TaxID=1552123 RepID=UPI001C8C202E|nr:polymorphic toxin type 33 domain-containing protein [Listeria booriae]
MTGIIRDFSQTSIDRIAALVQKEEGDGQWGIFDWFDDTFTSAGDIRDSLDNLDKYHQEVIDDQNIGVEKFDAILQEVESVDQNYASRFYNLQDKLEGFNDKLTTIANMITPSVMTTSVENFTQITNGANEIFDNVVKDANNNLSYFENSIEGVLEEEAGFWQKLGSGALGIGISIVKDVGGSLLTLGEDILHEYGFGDGHFWEDKLEYLDEGILEKWGWVDEKWYYGGRAIGDAVCFVAGAIAIFGGVVTLLGGFTLGVGGAGLSLTGVGAVVGVPAIAVSWAAVAEGAVLVTAGVAMMGSASGNIGDNWSKMQSSGNQSGSSQPTNIKKVNDSYLKDKGFDAHEIKEGIMGKKNGSKYDIYVDNDTGQLWVFRKGGIGEGTPTGDYIK